MVSPIYVEYYILVCLLFHHIAIGICLALPSLVTPAITGNSTDIHATKDQASWFTACFGLTGAISFFILPAVMQMYGRRITKILMNLFIFIGSIIIASAPNFTLLIIGRATQGLAFAGIVVCCVIIGEYSHPKRRGSFIALKVAGFCFGELLCHGLGICLTWRQLAWMATVPSILGVITTLIWPESPAWLAFQGRYEDCKKSFEKLRGKGLEARKELAELMSAQQELQRTSKDYGTSIKSVLKAFRSKEFLKPLLPACLMVLLLQACGTFYLIAHLIQIMKKMTGDQSKAFYFAIGFDALQTVALLVSSFVIRVLGRRTILFTGGSIACILLGLVCTFGYLERHEILYFKWLSPLFMLLYIFMCNLSITSITIVSKGELFPLHYRGIGVCITGVFLSTSAALALKITSALMDKFDTHGMLAIYLLICIVLLILLYFTMPETKDRTLQSIDNYFTNIHLPVDLEERGEEKITKVVPNE